MLLTLVKDYWSLQRSQRMSKERLLKMQSSKLKQIISHAYLKVPFYRKLYDAAKVVPTDVREIGDINRLPVTTKQHFRSIPLQERTAFDTDAARCRQVHTSGSTGVPITILDDPYVPIYQEALHLRFLWAIGVRPLDRVCVALAASSPQEMIEKGKHLDSSWNSFKRRFCRYLPYSDPITEHIKFYKDWKPHVLSSGVWYFSFLTRFCKETGQDLSFERAVTIGDLLSGTTREAIKDTLHAEVYDHYGLHEVGSVAWECPTHSGYHINAESLLLEVLRNGDPVAPGEAGEVYVTSFERRATPIIRYSTGDVATLTEDECPCGRSLPLLKGIQGRVVDFIQAENGNFLSPYVVIRSLQEAYGLDQFRVIQNSDLSIEVLVKTNKESAQKTLQDVQDRCARLFGQIPLSVRWVDHIDKEEGPKFRLVESRLTKLNPII